MKGADVYGSGMFLKATKSGGLSLPGEPASIILTIGTPLTTKEFDDGKKQRVIERWINPPLPEGEMPHLGLNKTNWDAIAAISGKDDDDLWNGVRIKLFAMPEKMSQTGFAVRVMKADGPPTAAAPTGGGQPREAEPIGENNAITLANKLAAIGRDATQLRDYLRVCGIANNDAISAPVPTWPRGWFETIKKYLQDPVGALQEASMNASPKHDDIPF